MANFEHDINIKKIFEKTNGSYSNNQIRQDDNFSKIAYKKVPNKVWDWILYYAPKMSQERSASEHSLL